MRRSDKARRLIHQLRGQLSAAGVPDPERGDGWALVWTDARLVVVLDVPPRPANIWTWAELEAEFLDPAHLAGGWRVLVLSPDAVGGRRAVVLIAQALGVTEALPKKGAPLFRVATPPVKPGQKPRYQPEP